MTEAVAQLSIGRLRYGWDDPRSAGFVNGLDKVNALAARAPGFVWRMPEDAMEAVQLGPPLNDPRVASTLSVWRSATELHDFVYRGVHGAFYRRGSEWIEPRTGPTHVVWRIEGDHRPDMEEALVEFHRLAREGPSENCFDLPWFERKAAA